MEEKGLRATFISSKKCYKERDIRLHFFMENFIRKKMAKD